ncbi:MAG: S9 family peptidase [Acidobacteria bacterium]|nr:S9 family peptidase [Acidobacteriota bacterium]
MRSDNLFCLIAPLLLTGVVQGQSFTLEQVLGAPFPSQLTAAKKGERVAWIFDARGERNVWVADGQDFVHSARPATQYASDDGQPLASLRLTADGNTLVYARGSEVNEAQESADPDHNVHQPKQQVWAKDLDSTNPPRLLGEMGCAEEGCEDIEISPDGNWALWAAKKKLWLASVDGRQQAKQLSFIRGTVIEPKWSPDSKSVAFVSQRGDHSLVGVFDLGGEFIRYLAPSLDKDDLPRWSTDGKQIAYIKTAGTKQKEPLIPVKARPWAIWIADAKTGEGHEVWHSGSAVRDSLPELTEDSSFYFSGDRIVFSSEQDGRNHLYSLQLDSSTGLSASRPQLLTPGDFDVEDVALGPDFRWVIYSSNQNDIDRRHIWRVPLTGGPAEALTRGETIEVTPVATGDGTTILCLGSSATTPLMPYVIRPQERDMLAAGALPRDFPGEQLVTPKQVIFKSEDGLAIHGQLFVPLRAERKKLPGLVFIHGGPIRQMLLGFHYLNYYHNAYAANQYLASRGYVVLSVNYRLGIMYGRDFREPPNTVWRGAAEYKDIVAAGKYLQALPQVDAQHVGLWGGSYGGFLTAMGLAKNSDIFRAGVDLHGVHDWSVFLTQRDYFGNLALKPPDADAAVKLAWESSPDAYVENWRSPVLLIHGDDDRNVPFEQTVDLAQRLREHHVPFEQLILPDEIHDFLMWKTLIRAYGATADFFDRTLKKAQPIGEGLPSKF